MIPPPSQAAGDECVLGFKDPSSDNKLRELWHRWKILEDWIELAIRPRNCHPDDRFLFLSPVSVADADDNPVDDLPSLKKQCSLVQALFNDHLSTLSVETTVWESSLVIQPSQIPEAGMGLYYQPNSQQQQQQQQQKDTIPTADGILREGSLICYYTGHVHTHSSARALGDRSYLMWIRGNTLVDPRPLPHIKARYINDPLNELLVNCAFVPTMALTGGNATNNNDNNNDIDNDTVNSTQQRRDPHEDTIRTSLVTTRDILPGEEVFVGYGDAYWSQQPIVGNRLVLSANHRNTITTNNKIEKDSFADDRESKTESESDDDDDIDDTFPFSSLFQSKLTKPIIWETATDR